MRPASGKFLSGRSSVTQQSSLSIVWMPGKRIPENDGIRIDIVCPQRLPDDSRRVLCKSSGFYRRVAGPPGHHSIEHLVRIDPCGLFLPQQNPLRSHWDTGEMPALVPNRLANQQMGCPLPPIFKIPVKVLPANGRGAGILIMVPVRFIPWIENRPVRR